MSTAYEDSGRANQKRRTREALVGAARDLIASGGAAPTVEQAAVAARVSRTTAYRYFPSQRSLLAAAHPEVETTTLLPPDVGTDPEVRLDAAVAAFTAMIAGTEPQQRTMLRLSLEETPGPAELPLRQGRAVSWFAEALAPLEEELGADGVHALAIAIRSATGIEARVWLIDVAGLTPDGATAQLRWNARALLRQGLADAEERQARERP